MTHSMSERLTVCKDCNAEELIRVPSDFTSAPTKKINNKVARPGSIVKEFIENTKQEIKNEKRDMTKDLET
mgnify:FL=1|tara:strand:- start:127 stop:339 length:213 start_codon:yes stop_codon:yes gene_type:complete